MAFYKWNKKHGEFFILDYNEFSVKGMPFVNNEVFTSGLDVFDGTPLLGIKPYIKDLDAKSDANYGWTEDMNDYKHLLLHIKGNTYIDVHEKIRILY